MSKPRKKLEWPTAAVLMVAMLAIAATVLAGPALGMSADTLQTVLASEGILGAIALGVMRQLLAADGGDDA